MLCHTSTNISHLTFSVLFLFRDLRIYHNVQCPHGIGNYIQRTKRHPKFPTNPSSDVSGIALLISEQRADNLFCQQGNHSSESPCSVTAFNFKASCVYEKIEDNPKRKQKGLGALRLFQARMLHTIGGGWA